MKRIFLIKFIVCILFASCSSHKHVLNCPHYDNFSTAKATEQTRDDKISPEASISNPLEQEDYPVSSDLRTSLAELKPIFDHTKELKSTEEIKTSTSAKVFEKSNFSGVNNKHLSRKELKRELKKEVVAQQNNPKGNPRGLAIASLVTGIVSLFIMGIPLGILAIVFGSISAGKLEKGDGRGMAIAGLVLGIIGIVGALVVLATLAA